MTINVTYDQQANVVRIQLTNIVAEEVLVERSVISAAGPWTVIADDVVINNGTANIIDDGFTFNTTNWYRVFRTQPPSGLQLPGDPGDYASTPDAAAIDLTGNMVLVADATLDNWGDSDQTFVSKFEDPDQHSYMFQVLESGRLRFTASTDGTDALTWDSSSPVPATPGQRLTVRAALAFTHPPPVDEPGLVIPIAQTPGSRAWAPDSAQLDITGDLDIRVAEHVVDTVLAVNLDLVAKWDETGNQRSYWFGYDDTGNLRISWSDDGTAEFIYTSSVQPPFQNPYMRATVDMDDGAGNHEVRFWTSPTSINGPWTQVGDTEGAAVVSSVFASTAPLEIGTINDGASGPEWWGVVEEAQIRDGINGTIVADPVFREEENGTTSFDDDAGNTWTVDPDAEIESFEDFGNTTVMFFTGSSITGPFNTLGVNIVRNDFPFEAVFSSTAEMEVGAWDGGAEDLLDGVVHEVRVINENGVIVASPNFEAQADMAGSFTDGAGRLWTINGNAFIFTDDLLEEGNVTPELTVDCINTACCDPTGTYAYDPLAQVLWTSEIHRSGLQLLGDEGDFASAPDAAPLDITGDIDLRAWITAETYAPNTGEYILSKWVQTAGDQRSYAFRVTTAGRLSLTWSTDGTAIGSLGATSTISLPTSDGSSVAVRATLDVDDGDGGYVVTFYTATSLTGPWTPLGDPIVGVVTTSIFASTADLEVGSFDDGDGNFTGIIHAVEVRDGIDGAAVADPSFINEDPDAISFTDDAGNTWTIQGNAQIIPSFVGENLHLDWALTNILGWEVNSGLIVDPNWGEFDDQRIGRLSVSGSQLEFAASKQGNDARKLLRRRKLGYVLIFPSGIGGGGPFNVYPVRVGKIRQNLALRTGSGATLLAQLAVTSHPAIGVFDAAEVLP